VENNEAYDKAAAVRPSTHGRPESAVYVVSLTAAVNDFKE